LVVAETVRGQPAPDVLLVGGRRFEHRFSDTVFTAQGLSQ